MTAFVFFIFMSAGEGEGCFEGDSTWLIHAKKNTKNTDSHPAVLLNSLKFSAPVVFVDSGYSLVVLEEGGGGIREDQILQFFPKT